MESSVPSVRTRACNQAPVRSGGDFVLYWMVATRRTRYNFALQRAVDWALELRRPLVILEPLRCDYRWASDRIHRFAIDGMAVQRARMARTPALYYPYVETAIGAGKGLLESLARGACVVVTDDFPCFFLPRMVAAAGKRLPVRMEQVDSNGLYPIADTERVFTTAASFRRHLQNALPAHLGAFPAADPLARLPRQVARVSAEIRKRWPPADERLLQGRKDLGSLPINHDVGHDTALRGGAEEAERVCARFVAHRLPRYAEARNQPDQETASGLSPYLHFGHISAHEVFLRVMARDDWSPARLADKATGSRNGWWGASAEAEAFVDELVTWREIGFNMSAKRADYDRYGSLPGWARDTLETHQADERPHCYTLAAFEAARTHDPLWNAAQRQLLREGRIHNYMRMLWGKMILGWSKSPREALRIMVELNNKYAIDGRDPNSYSGIFWCLGRYDRAWGPERPIFGKVRYMSPANTARKYKIDGYLRTYADHVRP